MNERKIARRQFDNKNKMNADKREGKINEGGKNKYREIMNK